MRKSRVQTRRKYLCKTRKTYKRKGGMTPLPPPPPTPGPTIVTKPPNPDEKIIQMKEKLQLEQNRKKIRFPQQLIRAIDNMTTSNETFNSSEMIKEKSHKGYMELLFHDLSKNDKLRQKMEKLPASEQCNQTIGKNNTYTCWLCGNQIQKENPACEHVLPVALSIMLTGIKSTKKHENRRSSFGNEPQNIDSYYSLSYDYAHKNCNSKKSDIAFIKWDESTRSIVFDEDVSRKFIEKIVDEVLHINKKDESFGPKVEERMEVYRTKINDLVELINTEIRTVLEISDGNMNLYWMYIKEIMKTYVEYEYNLEKEKLEGPLLKRARSLMPEQPSNTKKLKTMTDIELKQYEEKQNKLLKETQKEHLNALKSLKNIGNLFGKDEDEKIQKTISLPPPPPPPPSIQ